MSEPEFKPSPVPKDETFFERMGRKFKSDPLVPIGVACVLFLRFLSQC